MFFECGSNFGKKIVILILRGRGVMMPTVEKIYFAIMSGVRDKNIKFS